jgi:hypothetical protein
MPLNLPKPPTFYETQWMDQYNRTLERSELLHWAAIQQINGSLSVATGGQLVISGAFVTTLTATATTTLTLPTTGTLATLAGAETLSNKTLTTPKLTAFTVGTLPAGVASMMAYVTDGDAALAWGATVVNSGAGATKYLVWNNGVNWTVVGK